MPLIFIEPLFKTLQERHRIGSTAGKTGDNLAVIETADFFRVAFHHGIAKRNLAVASHDDFAVAAY